MDRRKSEDKGKNRRKSSSAEKPKASRGRADEWEEEQLDEEMEEIFHPASNHFSLADLTSEPPQAAPHFDENDYELHRRESFQYHQPLRKLYHKHRKSSHKKQSSDPHSSMAKVPEESGGSLDKEEPSEEEPLLNLVGQPPKSETLEAELSDAPKKQVEDKVQFYVGSSSSLETAAAESSAKERVPLKSVLRGLLFPSTASHTALSPPLPSNSPKTSSDEHPLSGSLSAETVLDKPAAENSMPYDLTKPKVKFLLGEESKDDVRKAASLESTRTTRHRSSRRHSVKRKHHGFNIDAKCYSTVLEPEEAQTLQTADIDDMASHRFDDAKGMRRHKIKDKTSAASVFGAREDSNLSPFPLVRKKYDHEPHEMFVELHELKGYGSTDALEWRQTARWIKYEEDVELGPDKWGKPHVPPLSFHSLLKLRQCLDSGGVLLDIEEKDLVAIFKSVVDCMVQTDQAKTEDKDHIMRALMVRHRHVNEKMMPALRRNSSGYGNLNLLSHDKNRSPLFLKSVKEKQETDTNNTNEEVHPETVILMPANLPNIDISKRKSISYDKSVEQGIQRRIPENAEGAAVLVGLLEELSNPAIVFVRLAEATLMPYFLEIPIKVRFLFVLLGPDLPNLDYHEVGRSIGALMSNADFHESAYKANSRKDLLHAINHFLDTSTVVPPGKWERQSLLPLDEIRRKSLVPPRRIKDEPKEEPEVPAYDPLKRTGRIFGGFINDIKYRYPWYLSDILDGFTFQCIASVIFIYFAAVSGAVAFGGLLAEKTGTNVGVSETLIGTSVCGIIFALFSGQPLIIIGTTAPLVLVDETLFQLRHHFSSSYLVMRAWVGLWCAVIAVTTVAAEGSVLVKFFSRFMQEIFATIISLIFIAEALSKLYSIFVENPLLVTYCGANETFPGNKNETLPPEVFPRQPQPNTALLSLILMIGTFYIAYFLRHFRNSKFLGRSARRALGDFGVPIGLVIMVLIDFLIPNTYTETLSVPEGLSPSTNRSWLISPFPIHVADVAIAFVGGVLVFILLFMETQICELIISKKKLKKGSGFHLDMVMVGCMQVISGLIGGPWQCAATVRSISHTSSLIVWSKTHAPGETPHIVEVKEQRLTNFLVSFLVGASVMMSPLLRRVPLATLFGVFLYMGISSLSGIHLYERFLLIFMPTKHHPDFNFVRKVRTSKMHLYTLIQVFCIAMLWVVKMYATYAFPFGLLSMILVHSQIKRLFTPEEIKALDEENGDNRSEEDDEPDFYEQIVA